MQPRAMYTPDSLSYTTASLSFLKIDPGPSVLKVQSVDTSAEHMKFILQNLTIDLGQYGLQESILFLYEDAESQEGSPLLTYRGS